MDLVLVQSGQYCTMFKVSLGCFSLTVGSPAILASADELMYNQCSLI